MLKWNTLRRKKNWEEKGKLKIAEAFSRKVMLQF